jgi:hypothetical protein
MRLPATPALVGLLLLGCSADPLGDPSGVAREQIVGGELDRTHNEVVELVTEFSGGVGLCTGTLIAPNLVLSARHCVSRGGSENVVCGSSPFSAPVAGSAVHVTTAVSPSQSSLFYDGSSVSVPPNGNDICGFDLSLVTLAENVPASAARPAIPRIDLRPLPGETYAAVGYGVDDQGARTSGRMVLAGLVIQCSADRCGGIGVADTEFLGETGVCSGDSGGPALDVEGRVIGVLSRGSDPCETPVYGGVEGFRDWLMETALAAAEAGGYEPPLWALTGSSEIPPGMEGDPCGPTRECGEGSVCYFASDPENGTCTRPCAEPADCTEPQTCVTGFDAPGGGLCLTPRRPVTEPDSKKNRPPNDSCSMGAPNHGSPLAPFVISFLAFAILARRRR